MIVLYANIGLDRRTGTEVVTADLARTMKARGHEPIVYSPSLGAVAREIEAAGIPVVENLSRLDVIPDVIHGHHHYETIQAIQRFPHVPALFVCHDVTAWHESDFRRSCPAAASGVIYGSFYPGSRIHIV